MYYCCSYYVHKKGKCEECPIGFLPNGRRDKCKQCQENYFGYLCIGRCNCKENERCDHVHGCVTAINSFRTTSIPWITHDSEIGFQDKERFMYIGSSGLLVIVVFTLITYICYKKTRKTPVLENTKSKDGDEGNLPERHAFRTMRYEKSTDANDYEEIDDNLLSDIKFPSNEEKNFDSVENDDDNSNTVKEDENEGYLNPYQPIISTEVDVHHYESMKDNSTASDGNQRFSGYLHPYQALGMNSTEAKNEYTEIGPDFRKKDD